MSDDITIGGTIVVTNPTPQAVNVATAKQFGVWFAGVPLSLPVPLAPLIDYNVATEEMATLRQGWPASHLATYSSSAQPRQRTPKLGSVFYPAGAGRHAVGIFLATQDRVDAIRTALDYAASHPSSGASGSQIGSYLYQFLTMKTAQGTVNIAMRMLPPKPLGGKGEPKLYALTFVDWRYDSAQIFTTAMGTEWHDFFDQLEGYGYIWPTGTDAEDQEDRMRAHADVLRPSATLTDGGLPVTAMIEAVCRTVGLRHTGQHFVDVEMATDLISQNRDRIKRTAGGEYPWSEEDEDNPDITLDEAMPSYITVTFPQASDSTYVSFTTAIDGGLAPPRHYMASGSVCDCSTASGASCNRGSVSGPHPSWHGGSLPSVENAAEVGEYVQQFAEDYRKWQQLASMDITCPGIVALTPDGVHDIEWTYRPNECTTRIFREPFHDGQELLHVTACEEESNVLTAITCVSMLQTG